MKGLDKINSKVILIFLQSLKDEDTRKTILTIALIPIIAIVIFLTMIVYILASPMMLLSSYFPSNNEYEILQDFKAGNDSVVKGYVDLSFNGIYPLPFNHDGNVVVTDDYGYRIHPISGKYSMHWGIDFGTMHCCEIKSIADGVITFSGVYGTYGNTVIIKHETLSETFYSQYSHLSQIDVTERQTVKQGEVIGLEGGDADDPNPGDSTGHHLHMGIMHENGDYVDPKEWLYCRN